METGGAQPKFERVPQAPEAGRESSESSGAAESSGEVRPAERPTDAMPVAMPAPVPAAASKKDPVVAGVESILEEGMVETFKKMDPGTQAKFKAQGERVASEVAAMVRTLKVNAGRVIELILGWLKLIPGVSRFFLEQEAKIKTDKILRIVEEERQKRGSV